MGEVRRYLEQMAGFFPPPMCPIERHVLAHGREHRAIPLFSGVSRGAAKLCFLNAGMLALDTGLTYAEGYAYRPGLIPVQHAWCVDPGGAVVDPTWDEPERCEYFGVECPPTLLARLTLGQKFWGLWDTPMGPQMDRMARWPDILLTHEQNQARGRP